MYEVTVCLVRDVEKLSVTIRTMVHYYKELSRILKVNHAVDPNHTMHHIPHANLIGNQWRLFANFQIIRAVCFLMDMRCRSLVP